MKIKIIISLILFVCSTNCTSLKSTIYKNQYGRMELKEMHFKESFDKSKIDILNTNTIYYHHRENQSIDMEFNYVIRFFESGQYGFFTENRKPILPLSYNDLNYNNLDKATYVGYYNIKDDIIILEKPNHLFRRSGKRNLDKYKVLLNGDLKSITNQASDYNAIYKKINLNERNLKELVPDW